MSYDFDDCEPLAFYCEERVKARKPHQCCETFRTMPPGEFYWRIRLCCDGQVSSFAQSEAAYHFARWLSFGRTGKRTMCLDFGEVSTHISESEPEFADEWARVCRGEITRTT